MEKALSEKQLEFINNSVAKWNFAHGAVRTGKTVGATFRFMQAADRCPDSRIYIVGHTFDTAYRNVIRLIMDSKELVMFRPFCTWSGKKLYYKDKVITVLGAKDEGAIGQFQGDTYSLVLCDEITLYPESIINMIDTRLSNEHSIGIATMNPTHPNHIIKQWIDKGLTGDPNYYSLHFLLKDNPFVPEEYKERIKNSNSGVFYKRNYLGQWCLAEGAIFDFFDRSIHVSHKAPRCAEYFVAGIDYGTSNSFACVVMGVNTGRADQTGISRWVENEYVWNSKETGRQKTNAEYANDVERFLEPYGVKSVYVDPSAASFKLELRKRGIHVVDAENEVLDGITFMASEMQQGNLIILNRCKTLIKEIEGYVWDEKKCKRGEDAPLKVADHCCDALRYCVFTHKVTRYQPYKHDPDEFNRNKYNVFR